MKHVGKPCEMCSFFFPRHKDT